MKRPEDRNAWRMVAAVFIAAAIAAVLRGCHFAFAGEGEKAAILLVCAALTGLVGGSILHQTRDED